jgi:superfamily II DNA or RNA helicase
MAQRETILTCFGYAINKASLSEDEQTELRSELTMTPKVAGNFQKAVQSFPIYSESRSRFYLPRAYATIKYGPAQENWLPDGLDMPNVVTVDGSPFDYQEEIITKCVDSMKAGINGLLCVPCGKGKTFMALNIAGRLRKRFLVIVDKEFLLEQWRGEITKALPAARVGILRGPIQQVAEDKYDVTLCMLQTLVRKSWPEHFFQGYGFAIFDECHHLGASNFSQVLLKVQVPYMLGLSATPKREDGMMRVFENFLGEPIVWNKRREPDQSVEVRAIHFKSSDTEYSDPPTDWKGDVIMARLLTQILAFKPRNDKICTVLGELAADSRRFVLVLSERKKHLEIIEEFLAERKLSYGYYIGGMKQTDRDENAESKQILLATYAMASDALNIKKLNTVILASPRKAIEQSTGRILRTRPEEREVNPVIVDIVDAHGTYQGQWRKRTAYYRQCKYTFVEEGRPANVPSAEKPEPTAEEYDFRFDD